MAFFLIARSSWQMLSRTLRIASSGASSRRVNILTWYGTYSSTVLGLGAYPIIEHVDTETAFLISFT